MPKIEYDGKKFRQEALGIIQQAESIITQYKAQGFTLTLRQLYYQFVARALLPNTEKSYTRLGNIISDARRAGLIDWDSIVDRTRYLRKLPSWDKPRSILESARDSYHRDLWANQTTRIEVWIEKDALVGVIEGVCKENDVPFFSCRGYVSDSEMWVGAMRAWRYREDHNQRILILHLGDHDPSGIDMTRDIKARLSLFSFRDVQVRRIALTMEQIRKLNPPPNPAKITDTRYEGYVEQYGIESWELDALEPQYITDLLKFHILSVKDSQKWDDAYQEQETERKQIAEAIELWEGLKQ